MVVIGEARANGDILFIPAIGSVKEELGGVERVIWMKLEEAEVKAIGKIVFEFIKTEIKLEIVLSFDKGILEWVSIKTDFFLTESFPS